MDTETRRCILAEAKTWLGTPFHHKGRIKGVGVDCGGYIYGVYCQFFTLAPFPDEYPEDWTLHEAGEELYLNFLNGCAKEVSSPVMAGLALFQVGRRFGHGAICLGNNKFYHAWGRTKMGRVQKSDRSFFRNGAGRLYPVKFFDLV